MTTPQCRLQFPSTVVIQLSGFFIILHRIFQLVNCFLSVIALVLFAALILFTDGNCRTVVLIGKICLQLFCSLHGDHRICINPDSGHCLQDCLGRLELVTSWNPMATHQPTSYKNLIKIASFSPSNFSDL